MRPSPLPRRDMSLSRSPYSVRIIAVWAPWVEHSRSTNSRKGGDRDAATSANTDRRHLFAPQQIVDLGAPDRERLRNFFRREQQTRIAERDSVQGDGRPLSAMLVGRLGPDGHLGLLLSGGRPKRHTLY